MSSIPANIQTEKLMNDSGFEMEELQREVRITVNPRKKRVFCRVPSEVREGQDPSLFNPIKTSIGPYHHGDCLLGEDEKEMHVDRFLRRVNKELEDLINDLATKKDDLWENYDNLDWDDNKKDDFMQMMVVDGCYLLEIMLQARDGKFDLSSDSDEMETYKHDMLLLENQIPMEVLYVLVESAGVYFFASDLIRNFFLLPPPPLLGRAPLDILDFFRLSLLSGELDFHSFVANFNRMKKIFGRICSLHFLSRQREREKKLFKLSDFNIPSATELRDAQIGITTSTTSSLMDISVTRTTLRLPKIDMDTTTKSIFYNLIMFERINSRAKDMRFSSYVYFMNSLLKDAVDCRILKMLGIISTSLSEEQVVNLFDGLSKNIKFSGNVSMDAKLLSTGKQLRERYNKNLEPWRKELWGKYLRSPWAVISVIAALSIFVLTIIQTVYTVLGYYNRL